MDQLRLVLDSLEFLLERAVKTTTYPPAHAQAEDLLGRLRASRAADEPRDPGASPDLAPTDAKAGTVSKA